MQAPVHPQTRDLSSEERLVLWAIRVWISHFKRGTPPCAGFARCFAMAGAPEVADSLDALLTLAGRHARTAIDVRCAQCRAVSHDEQDWLAAIAAIQRNDVELCRRLLGATLAPPAVTRAAGVMAKLAHQLLGAGLLLPRRPAYSESAPPGDQRPAACPDSGLSLVH